MSEVEFEGIFRPPLQAKRMYIQSGERRKSGDEWLEWKKGSRERGKHTSVGLVTCTLT